jgi:NADH-quinone oxidoreductase subunit J
MGPHFLIFGILYVVTIGGALMVLLSKDTVKSAMSLVLVMVSLAMHYVMMGQEVVGVFQIIIYTGAIMVLFLFVIMLLNLREAELIPWYLRAPRFWAASMAVLFFVLMVYAIFGYQVGQDEAAVTARPAAGVTELATLLTTKYALPFLLTSVLLLVAVIGAVVMGRRADPETGEDYQLDAEETA